MQDHVRAAIDGFMTRNPTCIGREERLSAAHERMRSLGVRHLPVLDGTRLVGILSQRDLFFVEAVRDLDPSEVLVQDAMSTDVYVVPPERPVGEVAARMVERKYGCAVLFSIVEAWQ
jgi:acetoin utilization protein AcuB